MWLVSFVVVMYVFLFVTFSSGVGSVNESFGLCYDDNLGLGSPIFCELCDKIGITLPNSP